VSEDLSSRSEKELYNLKMFYETQLIAVNKEIERRLSLRAITTEKKEKV
jgi:hypothetical protein